MPNYCNYSMKVVGSNKENVEEFIKVMKADYDYSKNKFSAPRHMFRVFDADAEEIQCDGTAYSAEIYGYCAWSVYSCMCDGPATYYQDVETELSDDKEFRGTTLEKESEMLGLTIEVMSVEPGIGFAEHYLFHNGVMEIAEETEYSEFLIDEDLSDEDFAIIRKRCNITETKEEFIEENWSSFYPIGGYGEEFSI